MTGFAEQDEIESQILQRESERIAALVSDDMASFAELLSDDLVHVHATSIVQDKSELLGHAGAFLRFVDIQRGPLTVRVLAPSVAVMTGEMTNIVRRRGNDVDVTVEAYVTQVWVNDDGSWKIASFHAVRKQADPLGAGAR